MEIASRQKRGPVRLLLLIVSACVLVATVVLAIAAVVLPAVTGSQTYTVLTRSMEPAYPPGSYLVVQPTTAEQLAIGDVITYQLNSGQPTVVTHRITSVALTSDGERRFVTQGDNNAVADADPVRPVQIRGVVWYSIPYLGWVTGFRGEGASSIWIPIAAGLIFCYAAYMIVAWLVERKRLRSGSTAPGNHEEP